MQLEIISPEQVIFSGEVTSVILPGSAGTFQVLNNHAPMISTLQAGEVKVRTASNEEQNFPIGKGFVEVLKNKVVVMV